MEYRPLNVNVISAVDLKNVKHFSKMDLYAEVSIVGYPLSKKRTFVDKNCGTTPRWNQRMEFFVDEPYVANPGLSLLFEIKAEGTFVDKPVGTLTLPIHELYNSSNSAEDQTAEFQVVTASGRPKGTLKVSYRFGEKFKREVNHAPRDAPAMAYPAHPQYAAPYPPQYPPPAGYGQPIGYGYHAPPPPGYGYAPAAAYAPPKHKKSKMGGGLGLGLGAGLLGGLLVGEMAEDIGESVSYADGYGDAMEDLGGFDF